VVSSSLGGALAGASVTIAGRTAITGADGSYAIAGVPTGSGTVNATAANCTAGSAPYSGLAAGGTVTVDLTLTCTAAVHRYLLGITWGSITNTGPTGRQVTATLSLDMGGAPGRPDVNGNAADELVGVQLTLMVPASLLTYQSRTLLDPNLDLGAVGSPSPGVVNVAVTSSQNLTSSGNVQLVRVTFNIPSGAAGTVAPTVGFTEVLAGNFASPVTVTTTAQASGLAGLTIP
jgi:hypothetical protein